MNRLSIFQIAEFAGAVVSSGDGKRFIDKISTDSRTLKRGELFVALRGENFDGHNFVESAAKAGAAGAIVDSTWKGKVPEHFARILAEDPLQAYQKLAANYRRSLSLKVVAITGSNGKTSTKDFAAAVLARGFRVTKTEGNFNNHVGLPRTILEATSQDEVAVWEIGMNHPGEVAALAKLAAPDVAILTNIGVAHIEFMGSREAIAVEKGALVEAVDAQGTVILNADDPFTASIAARARAKLILAGTTAGTIRASEISQSGSGTDFTMLEGAHRCRAQLPVPGLHMVQNAMLAVAAGRVFGLSLEDCAAGLVAAPQSSRERPKTRPALYRRHLQRKSRVHESGIAHAGGTRCRWKAHCCARRDGRTWFRIGARPSRSWRNRGDIWDRSTHYHRRSGRTYSAGGAGRRPGKNYGRKIDK